MLLALRDTLVATFNEKHAPSSRKYAAEQKIIMRNRSKACQTFCSHSSVFALEKQPKNLNFHSVFISTRRFGGYFQWNACTSFQKICSWTRYTDTKLIKNMSKFLVALLRFGFRETIEKSTFTSKRPFGGYFQWNACPYIQKIWSCSRHEHS